MPAEQGGAFFDTNVLLYLASADEAKARRTETLLQSGGKTSVQVLNEIASVARRKMALSWAETREFLMLIRELLTVVSLTEEVHEVGLLIAERHRLAIYDGMIVAAALTSGCETLLSEDMHHGLTIEQQLTIRNPFVAL
ncbi:putative nucleic acid-binding protein [Pseudaminobacter salicylatoxidans]|uniref:Ribonuclease VapC n=2 Tax=Pseudaminobacter salicylatoxidans TaxID=93369 RepID=A0A316CKQ3_PSESE|nr:putative nucleic acid-binding protein [Pseudaminobacter salicylatoxidans]